MSLLPALAEIAAAVLILAGAVFVLIGAIGTLRFPDFWARLHAASVSDSAGVILLFAGLAIHAGFSLVAVKLLIILLFLFLTGPTSTHATANAALVSGLRPREAPGLEAPDLDSPARDDEEAAS